MAGVNHLHSDELQPNLSAVAAAGSSLPKEPPAWSIDAKALLHDVRPRYASPTFVAAHSHLLWTGRSLLARARPRLARRKVEVRAPLVPC